MFHRQGHANCNGIILGSGQQGRNHDLVAHLIGDWLFCGVLGPIKPPLHTRTDETISATSDDPFGDDGKEFSIGGVGFEDEGASGVILTASAFIMQPPTCNTGGGAILTLTYMQMSTVCSPASGSFDFALPLPFPNVAVDVFTLLFLTVSPSTFLGLPRFLGFGSSSALLSRASW
jgi:hypothetical protein